MISCGNLERSEDSQTLLMLSAGCAMARLGGRAPGCSREGEWGVRQMVSSLNASVPRGSPSCYNPAEPISTRN